MHVKFTAHDSGKTQAFSSRFLTFQLVFTQVISVKLIYVLIEPFMEPLGDLVVVRDVIEVLQLNKEATLEFQESDPLV